VNVGEIQRDRRKLHVGLVRVEHDAIDSLGCKHGFDGPDQGTGNHTHQVKRELESLFSLGLAELLLHSLGASER